MIDDIEQRTMNWLTDAMETFAKQLGAGDDPTIGISINTDIGNAELQLRLVRVPGVFERHSIDFEIEQ